MTLRKATTQRSTVRMTVTWVTPRDFARSVTRASPKGGNQIRNALNIILRTLLGVLPAGSALIGSQFSVIEKGCRMLSRIRRRSALGTAVSRSHPHFLA
jgi:hypothetical protein